MQDGVQGGSHHLFFEFLSRQSHPSSAAGPPYESKRSDLLPRRKGTEPLLVKGRRNSWIKTQKKKKNWLSLYTCPAAFCVLINVAVRRTTNGPHFFHPDLMTRFLFSLFFYRLIKRTFLLNAQGLFFFLLIEYQRRTEKKKEKKNEINYWMRRVHQNEISKRSATFSSSVQSLIWTRRVSDSLTVQGPWTTI